jgi:hypothetical protein
MTQIQINGADASTVHLLHLDLPPQAVERFTTMAGTGEWPLKYGLGASKLRPAFVETVDLRDLGDMSLSQYLAQAYDVSPKALGADKARIDALRGHVVILPPQAFDATSQTLNVAMPLQFVGSYASVKAASKGARLRSKGAEGSGGGLPGTASPGLSRLLKLIMLGFAVFVLLILALVLR